MNAAKIQPHQANADERETDLLPCDRLAAHNHAKQVVDRNCFDDANALSAQPLVRILARPTSTMAIVRWSDACSGHYGHQEWRLSVAKETGTCALSGRVIECGDRVFTPRGEQPAPTNAGVVMHASVVRQRFVDCSGGDDGADGS